MARAGRRRRTERPSFAAANRSGIRYSRPSPAECRRRNRPGDTTARPRRFVRCRPAVWRRRSGSGRTWPGRPGASHIGKLLEHVEQEKRQPDAFALAADADQVHAVVPIAAAHQRQAVLAETQAVVDRPQAMLVERTGFFTAVGNVVIRFFVGLALASFQPVQPLIKHSGIARGLDIAAGGQRQPQIVVGKMGADTAILGRMPPVLDVTFAELVFGCPQQMLAGEARVRHRPGP